MSFHLRMWDFDLDAVLSPSGRDGYNPGNGGRGGMGAGGRGGRVSDEGVLTWNYDVVKEALHNVSF